MQLMHNPRNNVPEDSFRDILHLLSSSIQRKFLSDKMFIKRYAKRIIKEEPTLQEYSFVQTLLKWKLLEKIYFALMIL